MNASLIPPSFDMVRSDVEAAMTELVKHPAFYGLSLCRLEDRGADELWMFIKTISRSIDPVVLDRKRLERYTRRGARRRIRRLLARELRKVLH